MEVQKVVDQWCVDFQVVASGFAGGDVWKGWRCWVSCFVFGCDSKRFCCYWVVLVFGCNGYGNWQFVGWIVWINVQDLVEDEVCDLEILFGQQEKKERKKCEEEMKY